MPAGRGKSRVSSPPLQRAVSITAPHSAASIGMRSEPIRHLYQTRSCEGWVGHWVASGLKGLLEHTMSDDQGWGEVGYRSYQLLDTPDLVAMAANAVLMPHMK